ncbi:hypothetical protein KYC5002_44405 [Archangium violaceum]|uniref:hypothetical protein n=1 Tax=Archangium violaceum TaxID=83451 RepID=UPI002B2F6017|nr:hypothetical protein KYC5002_44405 [Archangium gephyra]
MRFFLPDSQDLVDPTFDFERERRSMTRQRQRDDLYAHEVFAIPAFDGFLVSKGIVDGFGVLGSRYTLAQPIISMGFIMDTISERLHDTHIPTVIQYEQYEADLLPLKDICRWTAGCWDFGGGQQRKWNELQNTSKDIELLANHLIAQYKSRVWNRTSAAKTVKTGRAALSRRAK